MQSFRLCGLGTTKVPLKLRPYSALYIQLLLLIIIIIIIRAFVRRTILQCSDTVGWVTGRASAACKKWVLVC